MKISDDVYYDKPMDLSNYLVMRTKEKLLLEANLKDSDLVGKSLKNKNSQLQGMVEELRKDLDQHFIYLDRMLAIAQD